MNNCPKLDTCDKIQMVLDKDILDEQKATMVQMREGWATPLTRPLCSLSMVKGVAAARRVAVARVVQTVAVAVVQGEQVVQSAPVQSVAEEALHRRAHSTPGVQRLTASCKPLATSSRGCARTIGRRWSRRATRMQCGRKFVTTKKSSPVATPICRGSLSLVRSMRACALSWLLGGCIGESFQRM